MEALIIASHSVRGMGSRDPYARSPSGFGRLLTAIGILGLVVIGLQSAAGGGSSGFGLSETAFAAPVPLR